MGEGPAVLLDDTRARGGGGGSPSLAVLGARQTLPALEAALGRMRRGEVALLRCAAGRLAFDSQRPPRPAEASAGVADPRGHAWAEAVGAAAVRTEVHGQKCHNFPAGQAAVKRQRAQNKTAAHAEARAHARA